MTQDTTQKPIQRFLIILSGIAFAGSTLLGIGSLYINAFQEPKDTAPTATTSQDPQLKAQVQGYELVLQREPDNQLALQGLVQARLQMNNLQGAVEPLEKLIKLNPDRADYKALLAQIKQQVGKGGKASETTGKDR
jgi:cytochrome c-type biogenesis protein CcmH/NrfG